MMNAGKATRVRPNSTNLKLSGMMNAGRQGHTCGWNYCPHTQNRSPHTLEDCSKCLICGSKVRQPSMTKTLHSSPKHTTLAPFLLGPSLHDTFTPFDIEINPRAVENLPTEADRESLLWKEYWGHHFHLAWVGNRMGGISSAFSPPKPKGTFEWIVKKRVGFNGIKREKGRSIKP